MSYTVSFFGSDHKCGTSQLSLCTAEKIAQLCPSLNILLVNAHESCGCVYLNEVHESMERIRPYLNDNLVDYDEIYKRSAVGHNLSVIDGANMPASSGRYHPDAIGDFLAKIGDYYDITVCDCGCEIDQGLSLGALFSSDRVYMILTQNESCIKRFEWLRRLYDKLVLKPEFIVNKYDKANPYDIDYISGRLQLNNVVKVPFNTNGSASELKAMSLLHFKNRSFEKSIDRLAQEIIAEYGKIQSE